MLPKSRSARRRYVRRPERLAGAGHLRPQRGDDRLVAGRRARQASAV